MKMERPAQAKSLPKAPTGIHGLDDITGGGLPRGRPTLICGGPGCGKTLMAAEFLIRGAMDFKEPGAFITFEETGEELAQNVASLGFGHADFVGVGLGTTSPAVVPAYEQRTRARGREHATIGVEAPGRIEHHPHRVVSVDQPHCEPRIVLRDRLGPDDHRVHERAHAVEALEILPARDEVRRARLGRDATVEALPQLADDELRVDTER